MPLIPRETLRAVPLYGGLAAIISLFGRIGLVE